MIPLNVLFRWCKRISALALIAVILTGNVLPSLARADAGATAPETGFPVAADAAAQPDATAVIVPKWLDLPALDGQCNDPPYQDAPALAVTLLDAASHAQGQVKLVHSTLDAYLCFSGLPVGASQTLAVWIDSDDSKSATTKPGDYEFSITPAAALSVKQATGLGTFAPIAIPTADFSGTVSSPISNTWGAELRISLEWLGGYAHTAGAAFTLLQGRGAPLTEWPQGAGVGSPATWGDLAFGPLYPANLDTGSAFVDGRNGYLVAPYAPALNPAEITIEAWARTVDGDCGTLVGNGQAMSYWLAVCNVLKFSSHSPSTVRDGQTTLDGGWHHVAVTQDLDGLRAYYVDGQPDTQVGWEPPLEPNEVPGTVPDQIGASDRMLRIGSDRDAVASLNYFHGYVRDLRIWDHVRTADEIRRDAFATLTGQEPGLLGLWPFTHGLQDLARGHAAGLVGNASLAREALDVTAFPTPTQPPHFNYPTAEPLPAWEHRIPRVPSARITVDGMCRADEYAGATHARLEPDHFLAPQFLIGSDALYLCTGLLWGNSNPANASFTLWLDRDGAARTVPGSADLRLRVQMDGSLLVAAGDGAGFGGAGPLGITSAVISGTRLAPQEDVRPVDYPWWSAEVRIPLAALGSLGNNAPLRLALRYSAPAASAAAVATVPPGLITQGQWPAAFDEMQPGSWGNVNLVDLRLYLPLVFQTGSTVTAAGAPSASPARQAEGSPSASPAQAAAPGGLRGSPYAYVPVRIGPAPAEAAAPANGDWPRQPPSADDFNSTCTFGWNVALLTDPAVKWEFIDQANHRFVRASGILSDIEVSREDAPMIHDSHDVDLVVAFDEADRWLVMDGGPNEIVESESKYLPANRRPAPGDHVTVAGQWIYDCGHEPRTEIHPVYFIASDHTVVRTTGLPNTRPQRVQLARVSLNNYQGPATHGKLDLGNAPRGFDMQLPQYYAANAKKLPFLRVTTGDAGLVSATYDPGTEVMHVSVTPGGSDDNYWEMEAGWLDDYAEPCSGVCSPGEDHVYQLTLDSIDVLDDHDGGVKGNGEWYTVITVNGESRQMFWNASVGTGQSYSLASYMLDPAFSVIAYGYTGETIDMMFTGYEDDDSDLAGEFLYKSLWTQALTPGSYTSPVPGNPDWVLHYHISKGGLPTPILGYNSSFWQPRLANEWQFSVNAGTLHVPGPGAPAASDTIHDYLTEPVLAKEGTTLFQPDTDHFIVHFDEFTNVTFTASSGVQVDAQPLDPIFGSEVGKVVGPKAFFLTAKSTTGHAGDKPYTLSIQRTWRVLPPDWGEGMDANDGRLVDLVTPDPATSVYTYTHYFHENIQNRELIEPWAWQHVASDRDDYTVLFPPQTHHPLGSYSCKYDIKGQLVVDTYDQALHIVELNQDVIGTFTLDLTKPPYSNGGTLHFQVTSPTSRRDVYQLTAGWGDSFYYNNDQCAIIQMIEEVNKKVAGMKLMDQWAVIMAGKGPFLVDPAPQVSQVPLSALGGYQVVQMAWGTGFNAILSSPVDRPVVARLYDRSNVMLGESQPILGEAQIGTLAPRGLTAQGQIGVSGLQTNNLYLLQLTPAYDAGAGFSSVRVGVDQAVH